MTTRCEIRFNQNPLGIYYAGQTVFGTVELQLAKPKMVQGVFISFDGFAYTTWTERKSYRRGRKRRKHYRMVRYWGGETYLNSKINVKRSQDGGAFELVPGNHIFDFACVLPAQLPSSFEGYHGHIRYLVKISLERSWKFNQHFKRRFTVLKHLDLNYLPDLKRPLQVDSMKKFTWSIFTKGPIKFTVGTPLGGYVSGQTLPVSIVVDNPSKVDVTTIEIKLKQKVVHYSVYPSRHSRREKKQIAGTLIIAGVPKKTQKQFEEWIVVPAVPPTNTDLCKIIVTTYSLLVEFSFSGMHSEKKIKFPVTIGTVPIISPQLISTMLVAPSAPLYEPHSSGGTGLMQPTAPSYSEIDAPALPSYGNIISGHPELRGIAPPSYVECVYGGIEMADPGDDEGNNYDKGAIETGRFVPLYPVYHFNPSAPPLTEAENTSTKR